MQGPFGNYGHNTIGGVLNSLVRYYNVPMHIAESVRVGKGDYPNEGAITYGDKKFATFRWFEGIEHAVMRFEPEYVVYGQHSAVVNEDGTHSFRPKLTLSFNSMVQMNIHGWMASEELHDFIHNTMMTNHMDHPCYQLGKDAGHFFQGGSNDPKGQWIMIEFWRPAGVPAWIKYLEENFVMKKVK